MKFIESQQRFELWLLITITLSMPILIFVCVKSETITQKKMAHHSKIFIRAMHLKWSTFWENKNFQPSLQLNNLVGSAFTMNNHRNSQYTIMLVRILPTFLNRNINIIMDCCYNRNTMVYLVGTMTIIWNINPILKNETSNLTSIYCHIIMELLSTQVVYHITKILIFVRVGVYFCLLLPWEKAWISSSPRYE